MHLAAMELSGPARR
jgi:hypothetical protein